MPPAINVEETRLRALEIIDQYNCFFITDICSYLGVSEAWFYKEKLNEDPEIQQKIARRKIAVKTNLRKKWYESDNPTVQIALYKLVGTDEELERLGRQRIEHTGAKGANLFENLQVQIIAPNLTQIGQADAPEENYIDATAEDVKELGTGESDG